MKKRVSILGCGWLGKPLGQFLTSEGFKVKGSVRQTTELEELAKIGIQPFIIYLIPEKALVPDESFFETDILIISIPPKRIEGIDSVYPQQIGNIISFIKKYKIREVVFISSTSVYNSTNGSVSELDKFVPEKPSGKAVLAAENLLQSVGNFQTTVLRFGGLIGADRNPAQFLQRTKTKLNATVPVNLIHLDDCIAIIHQIIKKQIWGETFNVCCPEHPARGEFYTKASEISGLPVPEFQNTSSDYKIIDSSKLMSRLDYSFKYASPLDYLKDVEDGKI